MLELLQNLRKSFNKAGLKAVPIHWIINEGQTESRIVINSAAGWQIANQKLAESRAKFVLAQMAREFEIVAEKCPLLIANFIKDKGEIWFGVDLNPYKSLKGSQYLTKHHWECHYPCNEFAVFFSDRTPDPNITAHELTHHLDIPNPYLPRYSNSELFDFCMKWDRQLNPKGLSTRISSLKAERKYRTWEKTEDFAIFGELVFGTTDSSESKLLGAFKKLVELDLQYQSIQPDQVLDRGSDVMRHYINCSTAAIISQSTIYLLDKMIDLRISNGRYSQQVINSQIESACREFENAAASDIEDYVNDISQSLAIQKTFEFAAMVEQSVFTVGRV